VMSSLQMQPLPETLQEWEFFRIELIALSLCCESGTKRRHHKKGTTRSAIRELRVGYARGRRGPAQVGGGGRVLHS
jgi:hypothetical protein